jgi:hypothetical protein
MPVVYSTSLRKANVDVANIFSIKEVNENGKHVMRCSRCEGYAEKDRGRSFQVYTTAITKAKEHIAVYCPDFFKSKSTADESLRHTLLINMTDKHASTLSKAGQIMRKFFVYVLDFHLFLTLLFDDSQE